MAQEEITSQVAMITKLACKLCIGSDVKDLFISDRKAVVRRHLTEQHSGVSHRCDNCNKFVGRAYQKHGKCENFRTTLVVRATGVSRPAAKRVLNDFLKEADSKIQSRLVRRSSSEPRVQNPRKRAGASMPPPDPKRWHRSPLERVEPALEPSFTTKRTAATSSPVRSLVVNANNNTSPAVGQHSQTTEEREAAANVSGETTVASSVVSGSSDQMSLAIGPQETLEASITSPPPERNVVPLPVQTVPGLDVADTPRLERGVVGPNGDAVPMERARRVILDNEDSARLTQIKLAAWADAQTSRFILDVGGTRFATSKLTLKADPTSLFAAMVTGGSVMKPLRMDECGSAVYYLDRDPAHFRQILNYLRLGNSWSRQSLPREVRYLYDLRAEAEHFELKGLVASINHRIGVLQETLYD